MWRGQGGGRHFDVGAKYAGVREGGAVRYYSMLVGVVMEGPVGVWPFETTGLGHLEVEGDFRHFWEGCGKKCPP